MSSETLNFAALQRRIGTDSLLVLVDNIIWPILLLMAAAIAIVVPKVFQNLGSLHLMLYLSVPLGLLALAEGLALLSGHFDLSIGAIAGFSAMLTAMMYTEWGLISSPLMGVLFILLVGAFLGFINGMMISKVGINPFLQTLAFFIIFHGAKTSISSVTVSGLPDGYLYFGNTTNVAIAVLIVAFVLIEFMTKYTDLGQAIYGLGSDKKSARAVGINTDRVVIIVFTLSGLLSGLAGLMLTGYMTVVPPDIGSGSVFPAFTAAVIGGISLFGGRGDIRGILGGVLLLGLLQTALNVSGVAAPQIQMINGIVLLFAILLYTARKQIRERIIASGV